MPIHVLEIHHHAVRIDSEPAKVEAVRKFYADAYIRLVNKHPAVWGMLLAASLAVLFFRYHGTPLLSTMENRCDASESGQCEK